MLKKIINTCVLIVMSVMLSGCEKNYFTEYDFGIIYTKEYKNESKICFFNQEMKEVNNLSYNYSNMSYDGFSNALIVDNMLYLLPKGHADKLDYGKVVELNLINGKIEEYDFNRTNITNCRYNNGNIYISSNLDGKSHIDMYDKRTNKIQSMTVSNILVDNIIIDDDKIFGIVTNIENSKCTLCEFDLSEKDYHVLCELKLEEPPAFMEIYHGNLYFPNEDILYEYNIQNKTLEEIKLPHKNAYNLKLVEDTLYIGCTDIFNGTESYVDIMYLPEKKVMKSIKYDGIILQMEVSKEDKLGILDYDKLSFYDISKEKPVAAESMEIETADGYYIGGFYLNENK